jgi:hypothetical protein
MQHLSSDVKEIRSQAVAQGTQGTQATLGLQGQVAPVAPVQGGQSLSGKVGETRGECDGIRHGFLGSCFF